MPRGYKTKWIIKVLESKGFFSVSQKGSHAKYHSEGRRPLTVIVPIHSKDIPYGTFRSILRQSHLVEEDFQ